jgi:hypothetical protein
MAAAPSNFLSIVLPFCFSIRPHCRTTEQHRSRPIDAHASNELRAISRDQNVISAGCKASCARRSLAFEFGPDTGERERRAIIIEREPDDIPLSLLPP